MIHFQDQWMEYVCAVSVHVSKRRNDILLCHSRVLRHAKSVFSAEHLEPALAHWWQLCALARLTTTICVSEPRST